MTRSAKDKLNGVYAIGAIGIAALIGVAGQSWMLFMLVVGGLLAVFIGTGQIRR